LDVVVSAKEAEKSKDQLILDRKELTAELSKLKTSMRRTQSQEERQMAEKRMEELQQELDLRNAQLADLQQQILSFNEDKEKDKSGDR
jgi:chromosome segregation ATPase